MTQPCYKCPDRCQNCHASCGKYAAFRAELDKRREYNKQFQPIDPCPTPTKWRRKTAAESTKGATNEQTHE